MHNETTSRTLLVAFLLCVVCSVIVSTAAVVLKPVQQENKALDKKKNILSAAGMLPDGKVTREKVDEAFKRIETKVVDLETGNYIAGQENFNARKAAKDPNQSIMMEPKEDIAGIKRRANLAEVYLVNSPEGELESVILPVHGYGLWSTLYGFLALETDLNTVIGLGFYEHAETPGLGGEVDNPKWKAIWPGKQIFLEDKTVGIKLVKGAVDSSQPGSEYKVDGLSGATLTSRGVENLIKFWMGNKGYGQYLDKIRPNS